MSSFKSLAAYTVTAMTTMFSLAGCQPQNAEQQNRDPVIEQAVWDKLIPYEDIDKGSTRQTLSKHYPELVAKAAGDKDGVYEQKKLFINKNDTLRVNLSVESTGNVDVAYDLGPSSHILVQFTKQDNPNFPDIVTVEEQSKITPTLSYRGRKTYAADSLNGRVAREDQSSEFYVPDGGEGRAVLYGQTVGGGRNARHYASITLYDGNGDLLKTYDDQGVHVRDTTLDSPFNPGTRPVAGTYDLFMREARAAVRQAANDPTGKTDAIVNRKMSVFKNHIDNQTQKNAKPPVPMALIPAAAF